MYYKNTTEASKSALLELSLALGRYRNDMILTGGWAPYFITKDFFEHCGSVDIDFILKAEIMEKYETIKKTVIDLGYTQENEFRFSRNVPSPIDGNDYPIHLDFLCDSEGLKYLTNVRRVQKDLSAFVFSGMNIAFDFNFEYELRTIVPNGGEAKAKIRMADLVSSFALKGHAIGGRLKDKDCYDIYALTFYKGSLEKAAEYFNSEVGDRKLPEEKLDFLKASLGYVRSTFESEKSNGIFQVSKFVGDETIRSNVFERVNGFLNKVSLSFK